MKRPIAMPRQISAIGIVAVLAAAAMLAFAPSHTGMFGTSYAADYGSSSEGNNATSVTVGGNSTGNQTSNGNSTESSATTAVSPPPQSEGMMAGSNSSGNQIRPHLLKGQISNVQLDENGTAAWVESGFWVLRVWPESSATSPADGYKSDASFIARITMVKTDGTAMHMHSITGFNATEFSMEGNSTYVLKGTMTITMREGPVNDVPITIKIMDDKVISIMIDPSKVDEHFGDSPMYGTVFQSSAVKNGDAMPQKGMM